MPLIGIRNAFNRVCILLQARGNLAVRLSIDIMGVVGVRRTVNGPSRAGLPTHRISTGRRLGGIHRYAPSWSAPTECVTGSAPTIPTLWAGGGLPITVFQRQ